MPSPKIIIARTAGKRCRLCWPACMFTNIYVIRFAWHCHYIMLMTIIARRIRRADRLRDGACIRRKRPCGPLKMKIFLITIVNSLHFSYKNV